MSTRTVLSFGGNAILPVSGPKGIDDQFRVTEATMSQVIPLLENGDEIILCHGNGPIVGNILLRNEAAAEQVPPTPLYICGADSQGGIGFMMQQVLGNLLKAEGIDHEVVTLVTQVVVDRNDPGFENPTKPIGPFFTEEEAVELREERSWQMVDDSGRGWRRVVASPDPMRIVEIESIRTLVEAGQVVIAGGGGGIPVAETRPGIYRGVEAVIDKDLVSVLLAQELNADRLIVVTAVEKVSLNFGKPDQKDLSELTVADAERYLAEGHFPSGSMGPKILSAIRFIQGGGKEVIITSPQRLDAALRGTGGTRIVL
jgi:carbamate kinase